MWAAASGAGPQRVLTAGHRVIGIEPAPRMAEEAANRLDGWTGTEFTLLTAPVEDVELQPGTADVVLAIGSLQYTADPAATVRPDGPVASQRRHACACSSTRCTRW